MAEQTETLPAIAPPTTTNMQPSNPFEKTERRADAIAQGAVAIESERAIAEAQGKLVIAQRFPRNPFKAFESMMAACQRKGFANTAFYNYPRGRERVSGPTIRLAEELARCWGNVDYGLRELSNREGVSEMEAYAWDMQTNTITKQQFTVRHIRDRREESGGSRELTDQRDIYEITANMGARRMRARILAILPDDFVDAAIKACRATLAAEESKVPMPQRIRTLVESFNALGVTVAMIETHLGHPLDQTTSDELIDLRGVYMAVHNGTHKASEYFGAAKIADPTPTGADTAGAEARSREMPSDGAGAVGGPTPPPAAETTRKGRGRPPGPAKPAQPEPQGQAPAPPQAGGQKAEPATPAAPQGAPAPKVAEPPPVAAAPASEPAAAATAPSEPKLGPRPVPPPAGKPRELF